MRNNQFYQKYYHYILIGLIGLIACLSILTAIIFYQAKHRPLPVFYAATPDKKVLPLIAYNVPNLLSSTILNWASKGATLAYTFDFVNYEKQLAAARAYFTDDGWASYKENITPVIETIVKNQLIVNGVVTGTPVISNQGPLPGSGYTWRVQIPFLVTYQSANTTSQQNYVVVLTLVQVPTSQNPQGVGIDVFSMQ